MDIAGFLAFRVVFAVTSVIVGHHATDSRLVQTFLSCWWVTGRANTSAISTSNGACALYGQPMAPLTLKLLTTAECMFMMIKELNMLTNGMRPIHPGEILQEGFLKPLHLSANALSKALHVPAGRVNDIVLERRGVTLKTALRLARYFGGESQSWPNLQRSYVLKVTQKQKAKQIEDEIEPLALAA